MSAAGSAGHRIRLAPVVMIVSLVVTVSGCARSGYGFGRDRTWSQAVLQQQARAEMIRQGVPDPNVHCPGGMTSVLGATMQCVLTIKSVPMPLTITLVESSEHWSRARYTIGSMPAFVDGPSLERNFRKMWDARFGRPLDKVDCPAGLLARAGATSRCMVTADGSRIGLTYTAIQVTNAIFTPDTQLDMTPTAITKEFVEKLAFDKVSSRTEGRSPDRVECPGELPLTAHQLRCTLITGPKRVGLTFTVTSVTAAGLDHPFAIHYSVVTDE